MRSKPFGIACQVCGSSVAIWWK